MIVQGVGALGALGSVVGAGLAFKRGRKPIALGALLLAALFGFVALNATGLVPAPAQGEFAPTPADDFDAPL